MKLSLCTASLMHALMLWPIEHCLVPRIRNLIVRASLRMTAQPEWEAILDGHRQRGMLPG
ncbi:hypothetical protein HanLR1_Chr00c0028g0694361 [Helianthus annuus]|nr:hypothetical protein HanLR1_Chr00c0028g0694361 [Helianthus annuus]